MPPKNEEVKEARKRKLKEILETPMPALPPSGQMSLPFPMPQYPSTALRLDLNSYQSPNALHDSTLLSAPRNFQSFTALLTADDSTDSLSTAIKENTEQIDQAIFNHGEQLKRALADMQQRHYRSLLVAAEERSAKKLKEKEIELHQMVCKNLELEEKEARTRMEMQFWKNNVKQLEGRWSTLHSAWQDHMTRGGRFEGAGCSEPVRQEEDQESSHVDPDHVEPVKMACRVCAKRVATMMFWQCRHVCVCKRCDESTKDCPVCQSPKTGSIEVFLE